MNAFINVPAVVEPTAALLLNGMNSASHGCWSENGGWLYAPASSGVFTLRKPGHYLVAFSAQVTGVAGNAELTLQVNGVDYPGAQMATTLAAATDVDQLAVTVEVPVYRAGDSVTVSVRNTGDAAVTINQANLVIIRLS